MQPPPQAAPSGPIRPPPVGSPRSMFWPSSPYRRPALGSAAAAPVTCPPQPVTDPFAFSRQMAQDTNADTLPGSSLPGAPVFSQRGPLPSPHANAGAPAQAPRDPVPGPLQQPAVDTSLLASPMTLAAQPGPEASRTAEMRPSPTPDVPTPLDPAPYIPGVGRDSPQGAVPGPTRPLNRSGLHDGTGSVTMSSVFPQPPVQRPDPWAPGHHYPPCPEGAGHGAVPWAPSRPRFPPQPDVHQSPGSEQQHQPLAPALGPLAGDEKHEAAYTQTGSHTASHCDPEEFRQHPRASLAWGSQEVRPDPAQGHGPDHQQHCPPGLEAGPGVDAGPGTLAMFFRGGEAENEENLSPGSAFDGISASSGHPPAHVGTGGLYQTSPQGSSSEHMQQAGDTQLALPQHGQPGAGGAAIGVWGAAAGPATHRAPSSQCENMEDLEFVQNQEVLPREPLALTPSSSNDPFRYGAPPGPPAPSLTGGEGLNLEAPDTPSQPVRRDSVSSSYSSKGYRGLPGVARPQELVGTFIQQEVGKPEDDAAGSFFKQIDSSPVSGDTEESPVIQNYRHGQSQPATPSPPKPVGTFQTSANSSFEPVKSQFVEVRPVEADHANMVMEVKSGRGPLMKQGAALPEASSPGNLEQPPDNMETLLPAPACPLPLGAAARDSHVLPHAGGPPAEASVLSPEKRSLARSHGAFKCESPVTTLWAQNELPDFGGNVLLAPASPALCVPTKPRASQVFRPPEEGTCGRRSHKPGSESPLQSRDGLGPSENLENPPKAGEEEAVQSQVTKEAQGQKGSERAQPEPGPPPQPALAPHAPRTASPEASGSRSPPPSDQALGSAQPSINPAPADTGQPLQPRPQSSSVSVTSASSGPAAGRSEPQWPPPLPPDLSYYYYRSLYDTYPAQYPAQYPPEPGAAHLYYQDAYRSYDSTSTPAYAEPEQPSPRGGLYDRPVPRQGYPEGYYTTKGGWSSQSDYYTDYYSQYDFGDPGRWDRYHYGARYRDTRSYDRRHWYDAEYSSYHKEPYAYGDRLERDNDPWRYDPRFSASFDEDPELRRDPYGDEGDRRSVHSEHSARSLRSHCSSVSSQSQQSQIYRNHSVAAGRYDIPPPPESFHGDYSYGAYGSNFNGVQGYPEYGYPADPSWPAVDMSAPSRPSSPEKFAVPHVCARFASGGQLIKVVPNLPSEGKPALVEVHSMETLLQHSPEQEEMRAFPGPLGKDDTHKVDVINFAQNKATKCFQNENIIDRESASLLWNLIVLLCRQNGTVVGTDIAELLLRDHRTVWLPGKSPNEANLIDFTNEALEQAEEESGEAQLSFLTDNQPAGTGDLVRETERFRELLLYGRKKDALESAMKNGLWGHALLLASKMDSRTHARVMTRFANSLPINDPLQTVYQLLSGRMPAASTCCGDEKWGDWRPHLAMVLSNLNNNMEVESRTMTTMGDTLASKGLLDAAHFCYLMAETGFGVYTKKTAKLVLIGSNHSLPFLQFATNEAIQRTEAYEYAQSLGAQSCSLPHFQVFKFIYACRLADMGLATQAFHYCEVIAKSILARPSSHSSVLISQLIQVASQLRLFDPQLKEKPEEESFVEPPWLVQLQLVEKQIQEGVVVWRQDGAHPQQCPSTPSSEVEPCDVPSPENPLLALSQPSAELLGSVQLLPSAPQTPPATLPGPARVPLFPVPPPPGPMEPVPLGPALSFPEPSWPDPATQYSAVPQGQHDQPGISTQESPLRSSHSEPREDEFGGSTANPDFMRPSQDPEPSPGWEHSDAGRTPDSEAKRPVKTARKEAKESKKSSESWFSRWLPGKKRTEAHLPDDKNKSIVWDEKRNRWVNLNEPEEEKKAPPPPPMAFPKTPQVAPPGPGGPPKATVNVFSRKAAGSRTRYVDVLNPGGTTRAEPAVPPTELFAPLAPLPIPTHLFAPGPGSEESQPTGAGDPGGHVPAAGQDRSEPALDSKVVNSAAPPVGSELGVAPVPGGEVPGDTAPAGGPLGGAVPFYNPAQFAQVSAASGGSKLGRISQRKHLALN